MLYCIVQLYHVHADCYFTPIAPPVVSACLSVCLHNLKTTQPIFCHFLLTSLVAMTWSSSDDGFAIFYVLLVWFYG